MGWLRLVGSLKARVFFAKEPYERDYILQKRPIFLKSLLIIATPYNQRVEPTVRCVAWKNWSMENEHGVMCFFFAVWCSDVP